MNVKERLFSFFNKSDDDSCWNWNGGKSRGYGRFWMNGKLVMAHRVMYQISTGKNPGVLLVCHRCDNPSCVNPNHLFLGSPKDNMDDRRLKNRHAYGERQGLSKLSSSSVRRIREEFKEGKITKLKLASNYRVHISTICHIIMKKTWRHVL